MRIRQLLSSPRGIAVLCLGLTLTGGLSVPFVPTADAQLAPVLSSTILATTSTAAPYSVVELSPTPPNLTQGVAPNITVTFDDSGSMASNYMGDTRPFDLKGWGSGRWRCAGVIDPRVTDPSDIRSRAMNGVYYNPNVIYLPPVKADGTSFPNADASLVRVPLDGIGVNRPRNPVTLDATGAYNNNPQGSTDPTGATDLTGVLGRRSDNRWGCGDGNTSPMDGSTKGPDGQTYPNGGPFYWRYKSTAPKIDVDSYGDPTATGLTNLYNSSNWEAVAVPNTTVTINGVQVNQWQNFANWYAYYRTRNLMTRTALSRVFGQLGAANSSGGYGSAFRVAWQNLYTSDTFHLQDDTIISSLLDANSPACTASSVDPTATGRQTGTVKTPPNCYRSAFFNWIFQVPATGNTPLRASTIRAGQFFQRGNGNTGASGDLHDPYWEPPAKSGADGLELTCRQNFHMVVTDGYWNESDPGLPTPFTDSQTSQTLPDGTKYSASAAESRVFWDVQGNKYTSSLANIAFNYWATNLRPDLYDPANGKSVAPYMPDKTTGVVTGASAALEQYFNPNNDPANWPHLVQYMVTLGIAGNLTFSNDPDCVVKAANDLCALRTGAVNSTGAKGWTTPANNSPPGIDDTWHAAINSRGAYFSAGNPQNLVDQLSAILTNISARNVPANTGAVNSAVLVAGALGFATGYSSADWSGTFQAVSIGATGTISTVAWDAGAILDDANKTDPAARNILTAAENTDGSFKSGLDFKTFTSLDSAAQTLLSTKPGSVDATNDTGQSRLDYLRGVRSKETTTFRPRNHLLGAIIGSQAVYVSYPSSGYRNIWPTNSPEQNAMSGDASDCGTQTPSTCHSYEAFVKNNLSRKPTVYVGANDGMLHAFDASLNADATPSANAGKELFAYVPRSAYTNLGNLTLKSNFKFMPTVDGVPVTRDVYFSQSTSSPVSTTQGWHTILVGGLRLGGRGVYVLDITDPTAMAAGKVLWEFNADAPTQAAWTDGAANNPGGNPSNLGFTYGQPNIGRLNNGKWVVLVPGGYFPDCTKSPFTGANCSTPAAASNTFSSLFVLDAQTGKLIRELKTPDANSGGAKSHGLATPVLGDYNDDQIDDVAFAGDLDGNLWRYDLSSSNPASWTITLAFKPATAGTQPITSMPRLFADPATNRFIVVFGTGKYLGVSDNTSGSAATQSVYGIRDVGVTVDRTQLVKQTLSETTADDGRSVARGLTDNAVPSSYKGWYFDLGPSTSSAGERVVVTPGALFDTGRAVIQTLIPGTNDPCNASIQGAIMVVNAATGGANGGISSPGVTAWNNTGTYVVGGRVNDPRTSGSVPLVTTVGGGTVMVPGLKLSGSNTSLNINDAIWRRRSWRGITQ
ncbi:PilC/PilY family type IV pilus protein [Dyella sp. BiH032]|uniref:pilus assembly protein n=1 Tax=Dyella sp. BiH032 TaxID=3075430 RepID=UPI00289330CB|nr:PilC/PilY family type IV pilus protein [Dyella sp. BiH032]WNL45162.1 PilC/PilY family type IV pilus protein [Dyella sp. BiH032]